MKNRIFPRIVASRRIFTTLLAASLLIANNSLAQLSIEFWEVGGNVVAQGSGTANLTRASVTGSAFISAYVFAANGSIGVGQTPSQPVTLLENAGGPGAGGFGNGPRVIADSGCGDPFSGNRGFIYIPQGYVSGTWLGGGGLWNNRNFASLGLNVGTYRWSWGSAADQKLTVSIGTTPIGPYWNGSGTAAWETETNWLNSTLPTTTAYLNNGSTISLTSAQSLESLFIGRACSGGTLLLGSGGNLTAPQIDVAFKRNTTGNLNFNGGTLTAPRIVFGSGNGAVNFNQAGALSLNSVISGLGTVRQQGAGTTTLTANNTYTGPTAVSAGRLLVNGSHTGGQTYTVSGTGVLSGTGTLSAGVVVNSGGTLSPGPVGAIGEFNIGSLTLNSGGALRFSLNGGSASFLNVTGAVSLNGGVNFSNIANPTADLYPLLSAGTTLSGAFNPSSIVAPSGYEIFYGDDNTVFLKKSDAPPFSASAVLSSGDALIVGGSLPFEVAAVNSGSSSVSFTAAGIGISNTTGSVPNTTVNAGDSTNAAGISFTSSTVGANQSGSFSVTSGATTTNLSVSGVSVYAHASGSVAGGTTLGLAPVHVGYTSAGTSTNSITVSNAATNGAASLRANLGVTNNNTSLVSVLRGVTPGSTGALTGNLATGLPVGQFSTNVTLTFFDDSTLPGALNSLSTTNITVTGYVYSGQGVWTAGSGGNWTSIGNWQVPGGIPGVDGALSLGDTATFGALGNGPVTLNASAGLLSITFSNTSPYVVSGSGGISLAPFGGTNPSITSLAGSHTISNPISAQTMLNLSNAASSGVTLAGGVSGNTGINKSGAGTTTFGGTSTYVGATVINNGTLAVTGRMANNAANTVTVNSNASFVFANNDVFGVHSATVIAPIVINGGTVRNSGSFFNALGPITMNGGTLAALDTIFGLSFSLKGLVTVNSNSTISGPGISLGAAAVTGTTFNVANGANLTVDSGLLNGWSVNINPPNPSFLTKTGTGTMQLNGTNTYTGTTTISAGTLSLGGAGVLGGGNYSGSILNSGTLVVGTTANQILGGVISGSGALVKDAAGTLTLGGVNTYTGGTVVSNGTIAVTGTLANNAGNTITVNSGGTFVFARNFGNTFGIHTANILTPMVINAGGLVTNSGSNYFSSLGPITLNGGTLAAGTVGGPDGYSYALKGTVTANSNSIISGPGISLGAGSVTGTTFNVASNATLTVNGGLTNGAGAVWPKPQASSLTKTGAGTLLLNGTNTYTGDTTISGGTIAVGGSGVLGGGNYNGDIANNGTLTIGTTANQTLGGTLSGTGSLVKNFTGTLTLDGLDNTYSGTTTINDGTLLLNVNHTGAGAYAVNSGATMGGTGRTTAGVTVASGGFIAPGNGATPGELTIGSLSLAGTLNILIDGATTSLLNVIGTANIAGSTVAFSTNRAPTEDAYVFLSASGVLNGTFGPAPTIPTDYTLLYDANDGIAFLKLNSVTNIAEAIFEGPNAVIGNGATNFSVFAYNGSTRPVTFSASGIGISNTIGNIAQTSIAASDGVELASLTFSNSGLSAGTNTAAFNAVFGGVTNTSTFSILVYDHASGSLLTNAVSMPDAIVGYSGALQGTLGVSNAVAAPLRAALGTASTSTNANLTIEEVADVDAGSSDNLTISLTGQGAGVYTNNVSVTYRDSSTLAGASTNVGTTNFAVTGTIYDHASGSVVGTNVLNFAPVRVGYSESLTSLNSVVISNAAGLRVALGATAASTNADVSVSGVSGLVQGSSTNISATLRIGADAGVFTNTVTLTFFDDSGLLGASTNVGTTNLLVTGIIYTGQGVWTSTNGGNWTVFTNWLAAGGSPGLDGELSVNDTATFGAAGRGPVTLNTNASLLAMTFSNTNSYALSGSGTITLAASGLQESSISSLRGTHTVSNAIAAPTDLTVNVATNSGLVLNGVISGAGRLIKTGAGTSALGAANTYTGDTIIEAGTLTTRSTDSLGSGGEVRLNGGTLGLENGLTIASLVWDSAGYVGMKDAVLDDVFLNITGGLALVGGAPHYFDLTGDFVGSNPTKLMAAPNMSAFEATQFDILGGLPGDYILSISNNTLWIASDVLIVDGSQQASGTNSFGSARFIAGSDPNLTLPTGSSVTIRTNVVMSNNSTVNVAGGIFGVTPGNSITVQSGSTLGGVGRINGAVTVAGTYAPGTNAAGGILTQNGNLTFQSGSSLLWTLYQNTTNSPGLNFSAPVALGGNNLSVSTNSDFLILFTNNVVSTDPFWRASPEDPLNSWTVMSGTDIAQGENFRLTFAPGSQTNGFRMKNFFLTVTNGNLVLNWSPGLVIFPEDDEFDPGDNEYPWISYELDGNLLIPNGVNVIIDSAVVMSNNSRTIVNGQFTSAFGFTVMSNSMVGGNGLISGNLVNNGLVSPGNSPGTLSIGGNFTQTASGTFLLEAASTSNFDRLNVSGSAAVDGTLQAVGFGGNNLSPGDRYQFLTANGGISGDFDTISLPAGLRGSFLISGVNNSLGTLLITPSTYTSMALTPNQFNAAQALDNFIGSGGDRGTVSAALDTLSASQYPAAFEQVMPSQYASLPSMAFNVANALNSSMFQQLWVIRVNGKGFNASGVNMAPMQAEMGGTDDMGVFAINPSKDTKWSSFVDGNGVFANASSTGSVQNYRSQSGGVSTGAAYSWTDAFATGVYVGYQGLQAEYDNGRTIDNAVRFGVFGTYDVGDFYFNGLVGGAYHGYTVNRYINFGGLNRTATGRPGAGEFDLALGTGYDFDIGNFSWGPFTTLQYTYIGVQGFNETGAGALNLDVDPYNSSSLLYTLGAQAAYNWKVSEKVIITPTAFAGWQHEFLQNGYGINSTFATGGPAAPFNYNTSSPARDNFYGGVGVTVGVGESWQATFIYSASAANQDNSSQNLYLGLGYKF